MGKASKKDSLPMYKLLRIIFPEIQVFDYIRKQSFIDREYLKGEKDKKQINYSSFTSENKSSNKDRVNTKESVGAPFKRIESNLSKVVLGQNEYLSKLCYAFKRPFAYGKTDGVKNTIFITGPLGSGKHLSVKAITSFLCEENIIKEEETFNIDLSKYKTERDAGNFFLTDLCNALYGKKDVIVFDNFDKCHQNVLRLLNNLVVNEKISLAKSDLNEYISYTDVLFSSNFNANSEICANNKYLVFITEKSEDTIRNAFTNNFMDKVPDILSTATLGYNSLSEICNYILNEYRDKLMNNLHIKVNFDRGICDYVIKNFDYTKGAYGLYDFIENNIYSPFIEIELSSRVSKDLGYVLKDINGSLKLTNGYEAFKMPSVNKVNDNKAEYSNANKHNDFEDNKSSEFNIEEELDKIVGLKDVKGFIRDINAQIKIREKRKSLNLPVDELQSLHMVFKGNRGTGKTMISKIICDALYSLGVLKDKKLVETDISELLSEDPYKTTSKTKSVIDSALGGILVINKAYNLAQDAGSSEARKELIDTLVKAMDDNKGNLLVILAGSSNAMDNLLNTNPSLKARFTNIFEFKDYTSQELLLISDKLFKEMGYVLTVEARNKISSILIEEHNNLNFNNGKYVRRIYEKAVRNQAVRLEKIDNLTKEHLITIEEVDVSEVNV